MPLESGILVLLGSAAWVGLNLMAFLLCFRRRAVVRTEMGILLYQVYSFVALTAALLVVRLVLVPPDFPAAALASLALHGIYSMTFLILWGSSDSGVSLRMLAALRTGPLARTELEARFVRVGDDKRDSRLPALEQAGFLRRVGDSYTSHHRGRVLAMALQLLHSINNFTRTG